MEVTVWAGEGIPDGSSDAPAEIAAEASNLRRDRPGIILRSIRLLCCTGGRSRSLAQVTSSSSQIVGVERCDLAAEGGDIAPAADQALDHSVQFFFGAGIGGCGQMFECFGCVQTFQQHRR